MSECRVCDLPRRLAGDALEDVVDEGVHDRHSLLADAGVGVDLLQHLVDVGGVGFDALLLRFLSPVAAFLAALEGAFLEGVLAMVEMKEGWLFWMNR